MPEMKTLRLWAIVAFALLGAACSQAGPSGGNPVAISGAVFQPPLGGGGIGVAYLQLRAKKADALVSVSSPDADGVEMHQTVTEDNVTSMHQVKRVDLPAGKTVEFSPGGLHLMVIAPRPNPGNATIPMTLRFESGVVQVVEFQVRTVGG